ncbi:MAG: rod shape-determining protein MreC [bacterium]|nr:rod shape-determining protein MreC [bacterium]
MGSLVNKKNLSLIAAAVVIVFLHYVGFLKFIENTVLLVVRPVERVAQQAGSQLSLIYDQTTDRRDLYNINKALEQYNQDLLVENVSLKALAEENNSLRQQLNFYSRNNLKKALGYIINRGEEFETERIITIDKGASDGIKAGQAVLVSDGIMIGKIFAVNDKVSFARLITDKQSQIAVTISGKDDIKGLLQGELGLTAKMDLILQQADIAENDLIITSGLEEAIPKGLLIGKVQELKRDANDLFQTAIVEPAINLNNISIVSVILY